MAKTATNVGPIDLSSDVPPFPEDASIEMSKWTGVYHYSYSIFSHVCFFFLGMLAIDSV